MDGFPEKAFQNQVKDMMAKFDADKNGKVSLDEFQQNWKEMEKLSVSWFASVAAEKSKKKK